MDQTAGTQVIGADSIGTRRRCTTCKKCGHVARNCPMTLDVQQRIDRAPLLREAMEARGTPRAQEAAWRCAWANRPLIRKALRKLRHHVDQISHTDADLMQEGLFGVVRAIVDYDPARGAFSTCAFQWIRQSVLRSIQDTGLLVRRPAAVTDVALGLRTGRVRGSEEQRALAAQMWRTPLSLDAPCSMYRIGGSARIEERTTYMDLLSSDQPLRSSPFASGLRLLWISEVAVSPSRDPAEGIDQERQDKQIRDAVESLPEPMRTVVKLRFDLSGRGDMRLRDVSSALWDQGSRGKHQRGVPLSRERVRQIEAQGLRCLRKMLARMGER